VPADLEVQITKAIYALKNKDFSSIRAAARFFEVNHTTLSRRLRGGVPQAESKEMAQILTNTEEYTLVPMDEAMYKRWISYYWSDIAGAGVAPSCCTRYERVTQYTYPVSDRSNQPQMASAPSEPTS
jgi:hypothetical protein